MADTNSQQLIVIQQYLDQGQTGEGLSELLVLLARQPEHGRAQAMYGKILMLNLKDYQSAEVAFKIGMRHAASYPDLYYDYGELLLRMDKGTESVAVLNKGLEVPGIDKDKIYSLFGKLYERQAKWEDAIEYYTKAILYSLSDLTVVEYRKDVERVKFKMGM